MKLEPIANTPPVTLAPRDDKARRRANAAPGYTLPFTADSLESGVDLETLLALPVPVYAYSTQITIHGMLPDHAASVGMACGYKHLSPNQNGSLGVRWGAIDGRKKALLINSLRWLNRDTNPKDNLWYVSQNSKGTTVYRTVETVALGRQVIASLPTGIYGSASIMRCVLSMSIYVDISIGAIAADSLWKVINFFAPGYDSPAVLAARQEKDRLECEARAKADQEARKEREKQQAAMREILRSAVASHIAPLTSWTPAPGHIIRITKLGTIVTPDIQKRGPNLCIMRNGKGSVISKDHLQQYIADARLGYIFPYDASKIPALREIVSKLQESMRPPEHSPTPPDAPVIPDNPAPTATPATPIHASALSLF